MRGAFAFSFDLTLQSQRSGLNRRPLDYESSALPLSYAGDRLFRFMPWRGLEPRRLAAPPPQDGVSTNFTTRANHYTNIETNIETNFERG
jgi:hypothetical protein